MAKRRRGARSAPPRASRHRPFDELVDEALATIPMPFAAALDEVAIVIADEPSDDQRRENELEPDDTLYGLYEGVPRTEWAADWAADAQPDHAVPAAARGGLRRSRGPRRRGLGDRGPRAGPPPRHRRRAAARPRRGLTGGAGRVGPGRRRHGRGGARRRGSSGHDPVRWPPPGRWSSTSPRSSRSRRQHGPIRRQMRLVAVLCRDRCDECPPDGHLSQIRRPGRETGRPMTQPTMLRTAMNPTRPRTIQPMSGRVIQRNRRWPGRGTSGSVSPP